MHILAVSRSPVAANIVRGAFAQRRDDGVRAVGTVAPDRAAGEAAAAEPGTVWIVDWEDVAPEDGAACVRALRATRADAPVLLLCPKNRLQSAAPGLDAGAAGVVEKPVDARDLVERVRRAAGEPVIGDGAKPAAPTINVALVNPFVTACKTVFETMCQLEVERKSVFVKEEGGHLLGDISGIMGLSGAVSGSVAVSLPKSLACLAVGRMLGETPRADLDQDVCDGVSELTNMIAGHAKAALVRTDYHFTISIPSVVTGPHHEVRHKHGTPILAILFLCAGEEFALQVAIDPKPAAG